MRRYSKLAFPFFLSIPRFMASINRPAGASQTSSVDASSLSSPQWPASQARSVSSGSAGSDAGRGEPRRVQGTSKSAARQSFMGASVAAARSASWKDATRGLRYRGESSPVPSARDRAGRDMPTPAPLPQDEPKPVTRLRPIRPLLTRLLPCVLLAACAAPARAPLEAVVVEELPTASEPMLRPPRPLDDDG